MGERVPPLLAAILAALSGCADTFEGTGCMNVAQDATSCPSQDDISPEDLSVGNCAHEIIEINGKGKRVDREVRTSPPSGPPYTEHLCCYPVTIEDHTGEVGCPTPGRPYYDGAELRLTPLLSRGVPPAGSARRAAAWARAGAGEHASVAAFSRLVLELMALGAPTSLLSETHRAALDEVGHAETCWAFAKSLGWEVEAGAFPFAERLDLDVTLDALAHTTVRDGCIAEMLGAYLLDVAAALAPDAAVKRALAKMAGEEARHAVLAFRIVAWAIFRGGASVRASVREALANGRFEPDLDELALRAEVDVEHLRRALKQGIDEVLQPAMDALLAA